MLLQPAPMFGRWPGLAPLCDLARRATPPDDGSLGGSVNKPVGRALDAACHRRHVNDGAFALFENVGHEGLDHAKLRTNVEAKGKVPVLFSAVKD